MHRPSVSLVLGMALVVTSFGTQPNRLALADSRETLEPRVYQLGPGNNLQYRLQELLIATVPGDVIEFTAGKFELTRQIDIATDNLTLRGQGSDQTILSFKGQLSGGQGIEAKCDNFVIEGLAVEDTAGNAIKILGSNNVTLRDVRTEWTGEALPSNGAYGLYPVQCSNVLMESCIAIGASDAGVYVGQSRGVIVRHCRAERNVAGIEIENTVDATVHDNVATNNTGGLLVFDLPGLQQKAGHDVRIFRNQVFANNHKNFAAPGNMVAAVPSGTGVMVMATDRVEVFDNDIRDNQTANVILVSYLVNNRKMTDETFDPISEAVSIHNNRFSGGGENPSGELGEMLGVLGTPLPDIVYDGVVNPHRLVDGQLPEELRMSIVNNGDATFVNFKLLDFSMKNIESGQYKPSKDLSPYAKPLPAIAETVLKSHDPPATVASKTLTAYRTAPKQLSEYALFVGNGSTQQPAAGVVPYTLNTALFTDYATKYRFIRVPEGTAIEYSDQGTLDFPDGTVIAKTFAYPHDRRDPAKGERLIETRIEALEEGEWFGYSYQWNDEQTNATLLLSGGEFDVSWIHDDGKPMSTRYEIPNANQCLSCHSQNDAYVPIGPTAMNINRDFAFADATANQLDYLAHKNLLVKLPEPKRRQRMPVSDDPETGTLDDRAHAWLDVNCAHCHSPQGTARTSGLDLRFTQRDASKFGLWKSPVAAGQGSGGRDYDIVPGKPSKSILLYRMQSNQPSIRMPNVGRSLVPKDGVALIEQWIAAMPKDH